MRLNAYLARAGVASRRQADELIKAGRVSVNGRTGELNDEVSAGDEIKVDGKQIEMRKSRYILLYKPAGYITTLKDLRQRRKVVDLVSTPERLVPVGRLDYDTTGALLLTNDGALAHRLTHPSYGIDKVYEITVNGRVSAEALKKLQTGIRLDDGMTAPARAKKIAPGKLELIIHEGRKHQVKRMMAAVGLSVIKLHRSKYASLNLRGLKPGQWRDLSDEEIARLKG